LPQDGQAWVGKGDSKGGKGKKGDGKGKSDAKVNKDCAWWLSGKCYKSAAECRFLHTEGKKGTVPATGSPSAAPASTANSETHDDHNSVTSGQSESPSLKAAKDAAPGGSSAGEDAPKIKRGRGRNKRKKKKKSRGDVHAHRRHGKRLLKAFLCGLSCTSAAATQSPTSPEKHNQDIGPCQLFFGHLNYTDDVSRNLCSIYDQTTINTNTTCAYDFSEDLFTSDNFHD